MDPDTEPVTTLILLLLFAIILRIIVFPSFPEAAGIVISASLLLLE